MALIARIGPPEHDRRGPFLRIFCGHCGHKRGHGHLPTFRFGAEHHDFDGFELRDWEVVDGALVRVRHQRALTYRLRRGALKGAAMTKTLVLPMPAGVRIIKCPDCQRLNTLDPFEGRSRDPRASETD